jgi:hemoglobin
MAVMMGGMSSQEITVYEAVGGQDAFRRLVAGFYARVAEDPLLRPLYPDEDLSGAQERLTMFLAQYWGGPRAYSDRRGHPRLRMRHAPFAIGPAERDAWLACMRAALDDLELSDDLDGLLWTYLARSAEMMRNRD